MYETRTQAICENVVRAFVDASSNDDSSIRDQLSHCVVRLTYAAAIYHSPDWQVSQGSLTKKQVLKQLRCTVLSRLKKCPVVVHTVDTHVQSEVALRTDTGPRHDNDIPALSRAIMATQLRALVRTRGVRGDRRLSHE
jgi:hypothetical protein